MNWRLILFLSLLGILVGIASLLGLTNQREWLAWVFVGAYSASTIANRTTEELFLHGFYLGILTGVFSSIVQALFVSTYLSNNPRMVDVLNALPQGLHPAALILIMGPIIGTVSGVVFGFLCVLAGRILRRHR